MIQLLSITSRIGAKLGLASVLFGESLCLILPFRAVGQIGPACIRTTKMTQDEAAGIRFVLSENSCDTFGNDVSSTIYASDIDGKHRVALVKFGPDERSPPPQITVDQNKAIVITIASVLDLIQEKTKYKSYTITYRIGHVEYPAQKVK
jgi:hypothetical protein